jgi:hypothetical protein
MQRKIEKHKNEGCFVRYLSLIASGFSTTRDFLECKKVDDEKKGKSALSAEHRSDSENIKNEKACSTALMKKKLMLPVRIELTTPGYLKAQA